MFRVCKGTQAIQPVKIGTRSAEIHLDEVKYCGWTRVDLFVGGCGFQGAVSLSPTGGRPVGRGTAVCAHWWRCGSVRLADDSVTRRPLARAQRQGPGMRSNRHPQARCLWEYGRAYVVQDQVMISVAGARFVLPAGDCACRDG